MANIYLITANGSILKFCNISCISSMQYNDYTLYFISIDGITYVVSAFLVKMS